MPKKNITIILFFIFTMTALLCCFATNGIAGGSASASYKVGFKLLAAWDKESGEGVEFALWYPSTKSTSNTKVGDWNLNVARDGKEAEGKFPIIIISHESGANKFSYSDTAAQLASIGFWVAAPTHSTDNNNNMSDLFTAQQIFNRPKEIHLIIKYLQTASFSPYVDTGNIGILGIGTGASTALILAGGVVDISSYASYCQENPKNNIYCSEWAKQRLTTLSFYLPQSPDLALSGIRTLALAAPGYTMLFTKESLSNVHCPIIIYKTENSPYAQADALRKLLPDPPEFVVLPDMDSRDLAAPCPQSLLDGPVWQCNPYPDEVMHKRNSRFNSSLIVFFSQQLYN